MSYVTFPFYRVGLRLNYIRSGEFHLIRSATLFTRIRIPLALLKKISQLARDKPGFYEDLRQVALTQARGAGVNLTRLNLIVPAKGTKLAGRLELEIEFGHIPRKYEAQRLKSASTKIIQCLETYVNIASTAGIFLASGSTG